MTETVQPAGPARGSHWRFFRRIATIASAIAILFVYMQTRPLDSVQFTGLLFIDSGFILLMYYSIRARLRLYGWRTPNIWDVCSMFAVPFVGRDVYQRFLFDAGWFPTLLFVVILLAVLRLFGIALDREMDVLNPRQS